jgi:hypothetical protein
VAQLQRQISRPGFLELAAYDQLVGLPDPWVQTAMVCTLIANANRSAKSKAFQLKDFLPARKPQQTPEEILAVVKRGIEAGKRNTSYAHHR